MINRLLIFILSTMLAFGQQAVNQVSTPPPAPTVSLFDYSSTYLIYAGTAQLAAQPFTTNCSVSGVAVGTSCIKRTNSTLTSIVVLTNVATVTCSVACGVWKGQRVTVTGASVDTDLNASYFVSSDTSTTATTYTFTTASVANATYTESTLMIYTAAPLTTDSVWAIQVLKYDGSNNLITNTWAENTTGMKLKWSQRANY